MQTWSKPRSLNFNCELNCLKCSFFESFKDIKTKLFGLWGEGYAQRIILIWEEKDPFPSRITILWLKKFEIPISKWKDCFSLAVSDQIRNYVWISFEVYGDKSFPLTIQVLRFKPCMKLNSKYFRRIFNYQVSQHSHVSVLSAHYYIAFLPGKEKISITKIGEYSSLNKLWKRK